MSTAEIENLKTVDPFAEAEEGTATLSSGKKQDTNIHIRLTQRNGRKTLTTIENIPVKFNLKKIIKVLKKQLDCNGTIVNDEETGREVLQFQGDHRTQCRDFIIDTKNGLAIDESTVKRHGF